MHRHGLQNKVALQRAIACKNVKLGIEAALNYEMEIEVIISYTRKQTVIVVIIIITIIFQLQFQNGRNVVLKARSFDRPHFLDKARYRWRLSACLVPSFLPSMHIPCMFYPSLLTFAPPPIHVASHS